MSKGPEGRARMSRFADKIRRASRIELAPMGFGMGVDRPSSPTLLCLLRLSGDEVAKANEAAALADAVIVTGVEAGKLGGVTKKLPDVPLGVRLDKADRAAVSEARERGADFVMLDEDSPAEAILEERLGFVLSVSTERPDSALRALAGLPLDAVEVPPADDPLTMGGLSELRRVSLLTQTPLIAEVTPDVDGSQLQALRDAGVIGVVLDGRHADKLKKLRETLLSVPPRGRRKDERTEALVPTRVGVPDDDGEPDFE